MHNERRDKNRPMKILMLGDVSRSLSCRYLVENLPRYQRKNGISFTVVNGENSAERNGIDKISAQELFSAGADVITTGNHAFRNFEAKRLFEENPRILRPANYPGKVPGDGVYLASADGYSILVISLMGVVMMEPLENPFTAMDRILERYKGKYDVSLVDFHAEATSEKLALAHYLDGKVTVMAGTHTHVTTADECILPKGTAYITDIGMCGPDDSVLGIKPECIIEKMTTYLPVKFVPSENHVTAHGILVDVDPNKGKAVSIQRITF